MAVVEYHKVWRQRCVDFQEPQLEVLIIEDHLHPDTELCARKACKAIDDFVRKARTRNQHGIPFTRCCLIETQDGKLALELSAPALHGIGSLVVLAPQDLSKPLKSKQAT
jgi:hypothetical protein